MLRNVYMVLSGFLFTGFVIANDSSQICHFDLPASTPDSVFEIQTDPALVLHKATGLLWHRCLLGQTYSNGSCEGDAVEYVDAPSPVYQEIYGLDEDDNRALIRKDRHSGNNELAEILKNYPGWRFPNDKELASIQEFRCLRPAINTNIFPGFVENYRVYRSFIIIGNKTYGRNGHYYRLVKNVTDPL